MPLVRKITPPEFASIGITSAAVANDCTRILKEYNMPNTPNNRFDKLREDILAALYAAICNFALLRITPVQITGSGGVHKWTSANIRTDKPQVYPVNELYGPEILQNKEISCKLIARVCIQPKAVHVLGCISELVPENGFAALFKNHIPVQEPSPLRSFDSVARVAHILDRLKSLYTDDKHNDIANIIAGVNDMLRQYLTYRTPRDKTVADIYAIVRTIGGGIIS
jgi:hypothetical protein